MLWYKNGRESDPFFFIYSSPGWLRDYDPVRDFPFWVNIEPTNLCNLDCIFCSRQLHTGDRGLMSDAVLEAIVDEVAAHPPAAMRAAGWGEPLMHPRFVDHVRRIKDAGVKFKVYTNGLLLTEEMMAAFIEAGLDELQFSMQGLTPEQYEFNRRQARFDDFRSKVALAHEMRQASGGDKPFVSLLTSVLKTELQSADPDVFIQDWAPLVDKAAVDLTNLNFVKSRPSAAPLLADQALEQVHRPCVDVFLALEVNYNGAIEFCGQDACQTPEHILGFIPETSLYKAWHGDKMNAHRQAVGRESRHDELPICRDCYHNTNKYDLFKKRY